jgi:hypothetical protein
MPYRKALSLLAECGLADLLHEDPRAELDKNGDGEVDIDELHTWFQENVEVEMAAALFKQVQEDIKVEAGRLRLDDIESYSLQIECLGAERFSDEMKNKWTVAGVVSALTAPLGFEVMNQGQGKVACDLQNRALWQDCDTARELVVLFASLSFSFCISCLLLATVFYVALAFVPHARREKVQGGAPISDGALLPAMRSSHHHIQCMSSSAF